MNWKTCFSRSQFSISGALIRENLRRFWAIPVIGFAYYFLTGIFPILMAYEHLSDDYNMPSYILQLLSGRNPFFVPANLLLPVIAALVLFRYLHNGPSAAVAHSMPVTRGTLFHSNLVSGLLLSYSPALINGLILMLLSQPVSLDGGNSSNVSKLSTAGEPVTDNVFSRGAIAQWIFITLLTILVIFMVSVFAGMITGTLLHHLIGALGFNFIIPIIGELLAYYCEEYLFGFTQSGIWGKIIYSVSPLISSVSSRGIFTPPQLIWYAIVIAAMYLLSFVLYHNRKLERAGDGLVFHSLRAPITWIFAFLGMTLLGMYFEALGDGAHSYRLAGYVCGALLGFALGRVIVEKTIRIFNRQSLKSLAVYGVIAGLCFAALILDITGYETRIPDIDKVVKVELTGTDLDQIYITTPSRPEFSDPDNIRLATQLQESLLRDQNQLKTWADQNRNYRYSTIIVSYKLKKDRTLDRSYNVPSEWLLKSKEVAALYESKENKSVFPMSVILSEQYSSLDLSPGINGDQAEAVVLTDRREIAELIACMKQDFEDQTYANAANPGISFADARLEYRASSGSKEHTIYNFGNLYFNIQQSGRHSIEWLEAHGYAEKLRFDPTRFQSARIVMHAGVERSGDSSQSSEDQTATVTDLRQIEQLFAVCKISPSDWDSDHYTVQFIDRSSDSEDFDVSNPYDEKAQYVEAQYYIEADQAPDFIKNLFL